MEKQIVMRLHRDFEDHAREAEGAEFWYARELQELLGYTDWRNFENPVNKAKVACEKAGQIVAEHFIDVKRTTDMKSGEREITDIKLSRYACYLIAQNGDPRKNAIAFAMTYFAVQTRKLELVEERLAQLERVHARKKLSTSENDLSGILYERGVDGKGIARVRSRGDSALFGGPNTQDMKERLGVPDKRPLADFLPTITVKAKDLASEITSLNVKRKSSLTGEFPITTEHVTNNQNMREMLRKSGILPEKLPREEDIEKVERKLQSEDKKLAKSVKGLKGE